MKIDISSLALLSWPLMLGLSCDKAIKSPQTRFSSDYSLCPPPPPPKVIFASFVISPSGSVTFCSSACNTKSGASERSLGDVYQVWQGLGGERAGKHSVRVPPPPRLLAQELGLEMECRSQRFPDLPKHKSPPR